MASGKKGIFGYIQGIDKFVPKQVEQWFEASTFLVTTGESIPEEEPEKPRYPIAKMVVIFGCLALVFRLTNLQIVQGQANQVLAEGNRVRSEVTVAPRGAILDRKGVSLVTNVAGYSLEIIPSDLPNKKADRKIVLQSVADKLGESLDGLNSDINRNSYAGLEAVPIRTNLDRERALLYQLQFANQPGVRVSYTPSRHYDTTPGLSHILGYTSRMSDKDITNHPDYNPISPIGRAGLESSYDSQLRGQVGVNELEVNAQGQLQRQIHSTPPQVGKTLNLTLDQGLQNEMSAALTEAMQKNNVKQAVGIAIDPQNGKILASVSLPSYDNNAFAAGISAKDYKTISDNPDKPLLNRAIDGLYPSGSTIKPFIASAALQEKTITPNTKLDTSAGEIQVGVSHFPDWKKHGITDVRQAIAESNDIFFYALGGGYKEIPGLGVDRLKKYLTQFGFGSPTGIDYANDADGLVPTPEWKKKVKKEGWFIGDTYHMAIGQGDLLVTPLQLVRSLSSIINGGRMVTPHIVDSTTSPGSNVTDQLTFPETKLSISGDVLQVVREGMRQTVVSGSARSLNALPFTSGGKTGTAQFGTNQQTHAWYIGFAPYDNPKIAVAVIVEGGGEGNAISVPVAGRVFSYYMSH